MNKTMPQTFLENHDSAKALFEEHGTAKFSVNIEIGNHLRKAKDYKAAAYFFDLAYQQNRLSKDALLAKLRSELEGGLTSSEEEKHALLRMDSGFFAFYSALVLIKQGADNISILKILSNCHESFNSGSEADWLFIRHAMSLHNNTSMLNKTLPARIKIVDQIPRRLIFYWDKNPPQEVSENFKYHSSLRTFDVLVFDKDDASEFLLQYFGSSTKQMFLSLGHPAAESDFFRIHAVLAQGGYYLDADEQVISSDRFEEHFCSSARELFVLSNSGPAHNSFFGAQEGSEVLQDCVRNLVYNCFKHPNLSMWLKTGPGPLTRAISMAFYRSIFLGAPVPRMKILNDKQFAGVLRAVKVSYRNDVRDWRVFEKHRGKQ